MDESGLGKERIEFGRRIDSMLAAPRVGKLARKLRKRAGLSLEQLGDLIDVAPEHIDRAEKADDFELVADDAIMRDIMNGDDTEVEVTETIDRYIRALNPNEEEEVALRYDLRSVQAELVADLREYCGLSPVVSEYSSPVHGPRKSLKL